MDSVCASSANQAAEIPPTCPDSAPALAQPQVPPQRPSGPVEDPPPYSPPDPKTDCFFFPTPCPHYPEQQIVYPTGAHHPVFFQPRFMPSTSYPPYSIYVSGPTSGQENSSQPKDYMVESLLVTIFCCLISGLVALMYSYETRAALARGDLAEGERASRKARQMVLLSLLFGVCVCLAWILYVVVALCI
ncbi:proline rich transmembrane protein 1B [Brienomyrus brachyistius]|uniref:proline rich transmembrane protein 1B n=1 Tax=Brienomyrus brachyistius TaxID=42636 RepID=UPI0020B34C90|nr:proline rich transmembrane protein 1B [Brienomyrus brachyistius]